MAGLVRSFKICFGEVVLKLRIAVLIADTPHHKARTLTDRLFSRYSECWLERTPKEEDVPSKNRRIRVVCQLQRFSDPVVGRSVGHGLPAGETGQKKHLFALV